MTEEIYTLAAGIAGPSEAEEALLRLLCREAERSLSRRVGERREECREAVLCAAAFLSAAGLLDSRGGAGTGVERFSVGEVSITAGSSGGGEAGAAERLRREAERLMAPCCTGGGFAFRGVRG